MSKHGTWIGVDPGMSGAIALYDLWANGSADVLVEDMPALESGGMDFWKLAQILRSWTAVHRIEHATVEFVHAMPKQGVTSSFSFGYAAGAVAQALASEGLHITFVRPGAWKAVYGLRGGRENKAASVHKVIELFPALKKQLVGPKGGLKDGRAEAVLLAHYGSKLRSKT